MRRLTTIPRVTAGLMWQPEIGPTANAMASRASPNAMATPTLPTFAPAITAVVSPAKTRTNVPNNSAAYFICFHLGKISVPKSSSFQRQSFGNLAANHALQKINVKVSGNSTWHKVFWHVSEQVRKKGLEPDFPSG